METPQKDDDDKQGEIREESNILYSPCCSLFSQVIKALFKCLGYDQDDAVQYNYSSAPTTQTTPPSPSDDDPSLSEKKPTEEEYISTRSLTTEPASRQPPRRPTRGRGGQHH